MALTILSRLHARDTADSAESYYSTLLQEAAAHPASNHEWLRNVAHGNYPDMRWVLHDFAREFHGYASGFTNYLKRVIKSVECGAHKRLLIRDLESELGRLQPEDYGPLRDLGVSPESIEGISHRDIYRQFCMSMGVSERELSLPSHAALTWREKLLRFLDNATPAAAVGAMGVGTEKVVGPIYSQILAGLRALPSVRREDVVFFEMHGTNFDQRSVDMERAEVRLLDDQQNWHEMRLGMLTALNLRADFFDHLHQRASMVLRAAS